MPTGPRGHFQKVFASSFEIQTDPGDWDNRFISKIANPPDLLAQKDIDGGLIGGASLKARSFVELVTAAAAVK